jgi:hypothetical protein
MYICIYDILRTDKPENGKYQILKRYKAKKPSRKKEGKTHVGYRKTR